MLLDTRSRSPPALSLPVSVFGELCAWEIKNHPKKNHLISIYDIKCGRIVLYFMQTSTLSTPHWMVLWLCFCHPLSSTSSTQKFQSSNLLWFIILTVHVSKPFFHTLTHSPHTRLYQMWKYVCVVPSHANLFSHPNTHASTPKRAEWNKLTENTEKSDFHPIQCRLFEVVETLGKVHLVTEWIQGRWNWNETIHAQKRPSTNNIFRLFTGVPCLFVALKFKVVNCTIVSTKMVRWEKWMLRYYSNSYVLPYSTCIIWVSFIAI